VNVLSDPFAKRIDTSLSLRNRFIGAGYPVLDCYGKILPQ